MIDKEQFEKASDALAKEIAIFIARLALECNCTTFEATLLARAIIHSLLDNLGQDAMEEFKQFLAGVRAGEIKL